MKQLLQNMRDGKTIVAETPIPQVKSRTALVRTAASLVSAGTERMVVDFAGKSLVGKAASRPDLVRQVINKARQEGMLTAVEAAFNRLDQPLPLGYSSSGVILEIGNALKGFQVGDRVACGGGGYAVHAEYALVPQNLMVKIPARSILRVQPSPRWAPLQCRDSGWPILSLETGYASLDWVSWVC